MYFAPFASPPRLLFHRRASPVRFTVLCALLLTFLLGLLAAPMARAVSGTLDFRCFQVPGTVPDVSVSIAPSGIEGGTASYAANTVGNACLAAANAVTPGCLISFTNVIGVYTYPAPSSVWPNLQQWALTYTKGVPCTAGSVAMKAEALRPFEGTWAFTDKVEDVPLAHLQVMLVCLLSMFIGFRTGMA